MRVVGEANMHARPPGLEPRVQLRRPEARAATLKLVPR
jgi:hypothetical protein